MPRARLLFKRDERRVEQRIHRELRIAALQIRRHVPRAGADHQPPERRVVGVLEPFAAARIEERALSENRIH